MKKKQRGKKAGVPSVSSQVLAHLATMGVGAKFRVSELNAHFPGKGGAVSGLLSRLLDAKKLSLVGRNKRDRLYRIERVLSGVVVKGSHPEGVKRRKKLGGTRKMLAVPKLVTINDVAGAFETLARWFDQDGCSIESFTDGELVGELHRRHPN